MKRNANLVVHRFVIMPDHVHLRIYIRPGTKDPLVQVGRFIQNFKRWSKWRASQLGVEIEWQENYHDRLCVADEIIDLVDKYIDNNALKWVLMHGVNPPMRVIEQLDSLRGRLRAVSEVGELIVGARRPRPEAGNWGEQLVKSGNFTL